MQTRRRAGLPILSRLAIVFGVLVVVLVLLTGALFVWPRSDDVDRADGVFVLSGDHGERLPVAMRLIESGVTSTLVFVGEPDSALQLELCEGGRAFEVVCLRPRPPGTRSEARAAADLAFARGWRTIVVVTSTQHATRAGLLFRRCVDATVKTIHARPEFPAGTVARAIVHEWLALGHALTISRAC